MKQWIIPGFMAIVLCGAASASGATLSDHDKQVLQSVGIATDDKMVTDLNAGEQTQLRTILDQQPAAEVKDFLVTRYFIRTLVDPKQSDIGKLFSAEEIASIKLNFDWKYCYDFSEKAQAMNFFLYEGTVVDGWTPVRGAMPPQ
jgi:hypothetical protein